MPRKIVVKQDDTNPVPVEVLATEIKALAEGVRKLRAGPLNDNALLVLVQNAAPAGTLSRSTIRTVFNAIDSLERTYLKSKTTERKP